MLKELYNSDVLEVVIISDIYDSKDEEVDGIITTKETLIKKNAKRRETIFIEDIRSVGEVWSDTGRVLRNTTCLFHRDHGKLFVKGKYDDYKELKFGKLTQKSETMGFQVSKLINK